VLYDSVGRGTGSRRQSVDTVDYAKFYSRLHDVVIRVYNTANNGNDNSLR